MVGLQQKAVVTPASVMKVQVALAALTQISEGALDGGRRVELGPETRTPGPVGMSLYRDAVQMSMRDLFVPMLTISDNVATDALIDLVGVDEINATTDRLGLTGTRIDGSLRRMLDRMAVECGFTDYAQLMRHDPAADGPPNEEEVRWSIAMSSALDPARGSCTTPRDMVRLLQAIWTDRAGPVDACAAVRRLMGQQLTRNRIASGFGRGVAVAAKSGGLMGIIRNEVGVVTDDSGSYAVAVFTRRSVDSTTAPADIDSAIGRFAAQLVDELR